MQTTEMAAACLPLTVTDNGCEQVCSRYLPESVTVSMSGERPATWYRPGGSQAENFPDAPTPTWTGRCPVAVKVTVPRIARWPGCCPPGPIGRPGQVRSSAAARLSDSQQVNSAAFQPR